MINWTATFLSTSYSQLLSSCTFTSTCSKVQTIFNFMCIITKIMMQNTQNNNPRIQSKTMLMAEILVLLKLHGAYLVFTSHQKKPAVHALPIHLPGENIPQFLKDNSASSLICYFHRPNLPEFGTSLTFNITNNIFSILIIKTAFLQTTNSWKLPSIECPCRKYKSTEEGNLMWHTFRQYLP